jgi:hypothetical protein
MPPISEFWSYFFRQGLLGVIILALGIVIWYQQRKLDEKDKEIKLLYDSVILVQDKRLVDAKELISTSTKLGENNTNALSQIQRGIDGIVRVLELNKS